MTIIILIFIDSQKYYTDAILQGIIVMIMHAKMIIVT